jgi:hypothetical protein
MSEHSHQCALVTWARLPTTIAQYPGIDLLEASLNGVKLTKAQAGKAKAAGMLKGALDLNLPVARGIYHGLRIEMKYGRNQMTEEQEWHAQRLREEGWKVVCCWDWLTARNEIISYLCQLDMFADNRRNFFAHSGSKIETELA